MPLLLIAALGCTAQAEDSAGPEPAALLGAGDVEWQDLDDGDSAAVIQGPQGGFHFLGSVRVVGIETGDPHNLGEPLNPTTRFRALVDGVDMAPATTSTFVQGIDPVWGDGGVYTHEMIGRFVILDIQDDAEMAGLRVELRVEVTDVNGVTVGDSATVLAYEHPLNEN